MQCYIVVVSNGPSVLVTELDAEGTVQNLIRRGFKNFNLYRIPEQSIDQLREAIGDKEWDMVSSELNLEWPVRVIERDNAKSFEYFQLYANAFPSAIVRNGKQMTN